MNINFISNSLHSLRQEFVRHGFDLRIVGGAVRDTLAGNSIKDIDLCTDANPEEQVALYQELGLRFIPTGIEHGTVSVVLDGEVHEITSLRVDVETDGRHAKVAFTNDWTVDLSRRDLTINAMALTFDGVLIDPFGGEQDLANGVVRFVGNADDRIKEDYLRILRWLRFLGRYGNPRNVDKDTANSVKRNARGLQLISNERIWSEIQRIVAHKSGHEVMELLIHLKIHEHIGLNPSSSAPFSSDLAHAQSVTSEPAVLMAAWLNWFGPSVAGIANQWKWSKAETDHAMWLCNIINVGADLRRLIAVDGVKRDWVVELAAFERRDGWEQNALAYWEFPPFPINGNDLIAIGINPGFQMGVMLRDLKDAWAKSGYSATKEDLIAAINKV
jgi:tRNA nucleotidyltransferase (CCA-adding enzyme)